MFNKRKWKKGEEEGREGEDERERGEGEEGEML